VPANPANTAAGPLLVRSGCRGVHIRRHPALRLSRAGRSARPLISAMRDPIPDVAAFSAAMRQRRPGHAATDELVALARAVSEALAPANHPAAAAAPRNAH